MDRSPRLAAILPLRVVVEADPRPLFAHTVDISSSGAKLIMPLSLEKGAQLVLEYKNKRAKAVVVWSKPMGPDSQDHMLGLRLIDDGQRFWLVELAPKAQVIESLGRSDRERMNRKG